MSIAKTVNAEGKVVYVDTEFNAPVDDKMFACPKNDGSNFADEIKKYCPSCGHEPYCNKWFRYC